MRALVTGGAGFIGSNLVDGLLDAGWQDGVVDDLSTGRLSNLDPARERGAVLYELDITDAATLRDVVARERPEAIFHLAAQIDVRRSVADCAFAAGDNVVGTINDLEAAREVGARVVFSSTGGAIYGETDVLPSPETLGPTPEAPYGLSKFCAEHYLKLYSRLHGLSTVALRYGIVYGPRQDPLGEAGVVAIFCGKALAGETATVCGDGRQTRDYGYGGDIVRANLEAVQRRDVTGAVNVGTGRETSVLDLAGALEGLMGGGFRYEHAPPRQGEVQRSCLDVSLAASALGWRAEMGLDEGLRLTLDATRDAAASS